MLHSDIPSNQEVKNYLDRRFGQENAALHFIRTQIEADALLPHIQIPIHVGKMIYLGKNAKASSDPRNWHLGRI